MTNGFRGKFPCPSCRCEITWEEPYKTWLRQNPRLDSRDHCMVIGDCDLIVYRYGTRWSPERQADRQIRWHMIVEVKTFAAGRSRSQEESHWVTNQILTTTKDVERNQNGQFERNHGYNIRHVYVDMPREYGGEKKVLVLSYGVQLLQLSGRSFEDSALRWNGYDVTLDEVTELLAFDRHPHSRQPMDSYRMHKAARMLPPSLFDDDCEGHAAKALPHHPKVVG
jgi:hypothetical protein